MNTQRGRKDRLPPQSTSPPSEPSQVMTSGPSALSCSPIVIPTSRDTSNSCDCCLGANSATPESLNSRVSMGEVASHAGATSDEQQCEKQSPRHQRRHLRRSNPWWLVGYRINLLALFSSVTLLYLFSSSSMMLSPVSGIRLSIRPFYPVRRAIELPQHKKMSKKPCSVKGKGSGTCMFVWECIRREGTSLGICADEFMFGTCCAHDPVFNSIDNNNLFSSSNIKGTDQSSTSFFQTLNSIHQKKPYNSPAVSQQAATTTKLSTTTGTTTTAETTSRKPPYHATMKSPVYAPPESTSLSTSSLKPSTSSQKPSTTSQTSSTTSLTTTSNRPMSFDDRYIYQYSKPQSASRPMDDVRTESPPVSSTALMTGMNQVKESTSVSTPGTTTLQVDFPSATLTEDNLISISDVPSSTTITATTTTTAATSTTSVSSTTNNEKPVDPWSTSRPWTTTTHAGNRPTYRPPPAKYPPRPWLFRPKPSTTSTSTAPSTSAVSSTTSTSTTTSSMSPTTTSVSASVSPNNPVSTTAQPTTTSTMSTTTMTTTTQLPVSMAKPVFANGSQPATISATAGSQGRFEECGVPPLYAQGRIVGGRDSAFGQFPWQVSVRRTSFFGFSSTHRCGGALINEQWVATAGHCVEDLLPTQIRIRVGEYDFSNVLEVHPFQERAVSKKVVHPKYNFFTYEYDLALVKLEKPIDRMPHVVPICLPGSDDLLIGENATVTGWGRLSEGGTLPTILQNVQVPIVSNEKCKDMFMASGRHEYIPDIFLCAGYEKGGRDSCQGDSGGPLQVKGKDGRMFLAGIISWGIGCAEPNLPGVCTRISKFREWIIENVT